MSEDTTSFTTTCRSYMSPSQRRKPDHGDSRSVELPDDASALVSEIGEHQGDMSPKRLEIGDASAKS